MNVNFENNNSKKKGAEEKANYFKLHKIVNEESTNKYEPGKRLRDGGFVAWPENKLSLTQECGDIEISESRLKDGGYVAYPINN